MKPDTLTSEIALSAVLIGGLTTVVANANPLIPLDGYYALSDYLEIPNLRQRALAYFTWLVRRHLLRLAVPAPQASPREQRVFLLYGGLSALYSTALLATVLFFLAGWVDKALGSLGVLGLVALALGWTWTPIRGWARAVATSFREHREFWRRREIKPFLGGFAVLLLLLGFLVPWPLTVQGRFAVRAPSTLLVAPEDAVVEQVYVREGARVEPGALMARFRNLGLEQEAGKHQRVADSLAALAQAAWGRGATGEARRLGEERDQELARLEGLRLRLGAFELRAPRAGIVVTPRPEEATGRWIPGGGTLLELFASDSLEADVLLVGAGAAVVHAGFPASLLFYADPSRPMTARVGAVAVAGRGAAGTIEARVGLASDVGWRTGMTGEARITLRRSSLFGALWWKLRASLRSDLVL